MKTTTDLFEILKDFFSLHKLQEIIIDYLGKTTTIIELEEHNSNSNIQSFDKSRAFHLENFIAKRMPLALICVNSKYIIEDWNQQSEKIFGWSRESIINKSLIEMMIPLKDRADHKANIEKNLIHSVDQFKLDLQLEMVMLKKNREPLPVAVTISTMQREHNNYELCYFIREIPKMVNLQSELNIRNAQLDLALESIGAGNWEWDFITNKRTVSHIVNRLMGIEQQDILTPEIDKVISLSIHPDDRQKVADYFQNQVYHSKQSLYELTYRSIWKDKSVHELMSRGHIFRVPSGEPTSMIGMTWEITHLKQLERERIAAIQKANLEFEKNVKEAEEYQRRQEEFSNFICHEIRNPLNGIMGATDWIDSVEKSLSSLLSMNSQIAEQLKLLKEAKEIISESAKLQYIVVDEVLDFAKLQAGKVKLTNINFNPKLAIASAISIFSARLNSKGINIVLETSAVNKMVEADVFRFKQIIINLLSNAIKFTEKGHIRLTAHFTSLPGNSQQKSNDVFQNAASMVSPIQEENTSEYLECIVEDTGIGMDKKEMENLFNPYQQANDKISRLHGGTGLGLVICKRLVELLGGKIKVASQKNIGTKFTFTIQYKPLSPSILNTIVLDKEQLYEDILKPSTSSNQKVLIVDDAIINQRILVRIINNVGHLCEVATNGLEALEENSKAQFDVIFMDVSMPTMDGIEATIKIREREKKLNLPAVPIIGISANRSDKQIKRAKEAGMTDFISKPYLKEDIIAILDKYSKPIMNRTPLSSGYSSITTPSLDVKVSTEATHLLFSGTASTGPATNTSLPITVSTKSAYDLLRYPTINAMTRTDSMTRTIVSPTPKMISNGNAKTNWCCCFSHPKITPSSSSK